MLKTPVVVVFFTRPVPSEPKNCAPVNPESTVPCTINLFANGTSAEPFTLLPARFLAVVHVAALPVVFWLNVGKVLPTPVRSLLVRTCVSEVPTIAPLGAATDEVRVVADPAI